MYYGTLPTTVGNQTRFVLGYSDRRFSVLPAFKKIESFNAYIAATLQSTERMDDGSIHCALLL